MRIVWISNNIKMQYNSFEEKLRNQLIHAEMTPRPQVWQEIEKQLPTPKEPNGNKKYVWGLLLLLLTSAIGGYSYYCSDKQIAKDKTALTEKKVQPSQIAPATKNAVDKPSQALSQEPSIPISALPKETHSKKGLVEDKTPTMAVWSPTNSQTVPLVSVVRSLIATNKAEDSALPQGDNTLITKQIVEVSELQKEMTNVLPPAPAVAIEKATIHTEEETQSKPSILIQKATYPRKDIERVEKNTDLTATSSPKLKRPKNNKWEFTTAVGLNALLHNGGFKTDGGQIVNPFIINTTGIIQLELADSSRKIEINSTSTYKDFVASNDVGEIRLLESANSRYISTGFVYHIRPFLGIETSIRFQKQDFSAINVQYQRNQNFYDMYQNRTGSQRLGGLSYSTYLIETPLCLSAYLPIMTPRLKSVFSIGGTYRRWMFDQRTSSFVTNARGVSNFNNGKLLQYNRLIESSSSFYTRSNFSIQARVGIQYHLIHNMSIFTAVHVQHLLKPMYKETFSQKSPLIIGIETGLRF
jgi:hypothetical protein